jgi:transcriptional regulator with XRE-family HTH domain
MDRKELTQEIAIKLLKLRKSLNYTTVDMAQKLGIKRGSYVRNEQSLTIPDTMSLYRLAINLDLSLDWLLLDRGTRFYKEKVPAKKDFSTPSTSLSVSLEKDRLSAEIMELIEHMENVPMLRHEILTQFHKFKEAHPEIIEREMKKKK